MEPAIREHGAAQGTETPTRSRRVSQRVLLGRGPAEGVPSWLGLRVYYLYGNFLANFSCVLALLFFPWRDFLGPFGSITEGGYTGVRPSAGAGREAGGLGLGLEQQGFPDSARRWGAQEGCEPPSAQHTAPQGLLLCVSVCVHVCVQLYIISSSESPPIICVYVCVHVCVYTCVQLYTMPV